MTEVKFSKPILYDFTITTELDNGEVEEKHYVGTRMGASGVDGHLIIEIYDGMEPVHIRLLAEGVNATRKGKHKKSVQAVPPCE